MPFGSDLVTHVGIKRYLFYELQFILYASLLLLLLYKVNSLDML